MRQPLVSTPSLASTAGTALRCASADGERPLPLGRPGAGQHRRQRLGEPPEHRLDARGGEAVVVVGEQRVVGAGGVVEAGRVGARELDVAPQRRGERREVVRLPGGHPHRLAVGERLRHLGGQLAGDAASALPVAPGEAHDVAVQLGQAVVDLELGEPLADVVGGGTLVREPLERGHLRAAAGAALGGHHRALVPGGQPAEGLEVAELGEPRPQGRERAMFRIRDRRHAAEATASANPLLRAGCDKRRVAGR